MSDETKSAAERAMEAVRADAVLGKLEWRLRGKTVQCFFDGFEFKMVAHSRADWYGAAGLFSSSLQAPAVAVSWLSARVSALFAACRAVDPEHARAVEERDALRSELHYYKGREKHFATVLGVAEGGRYANDWDSRLQRLVNEAAALRREVRYLRAYGNKDCTKMAEDAMERRELEEGE